MSKAYPSNLTHAQYEFLSEMIPEPKPGGRKREVDFKTRMCTPLREIYFLCRLQY